MESEFLRLEKLVKALRGLNLPQSKRKRTFFEIAGIERREVSISKVVAFFLESEGEHGLGDLWIRSLLDAAALKRGGFSSALYDLQSTQCLLEVVTTNVEENLRIDIVVESQDFVLGIENKIGASLYNNLQAYAGQVSQMAGAEKKPLLITLTLNDEGHETDCWAERCALEGAILCNVTYSELFSFVKASLGDAYLDADSDWLHLMRDFMRTIENLEEPSMEANEELFEFLGENIEDVLLMQQKMEEASSAMKARGERLRDIMAEDEWLKSSGIGQPRVYSPNKYYLGCATYYSVGALGVKDAIHPEIGHDITEMSLQCWVRNASVKSMVTKRLADAGYSPEANGDHNIKAKKLPLGIADEELVEEFKKMVEALRLFD